MSKLIPDERVTFGITTHADLEVSNVFHSNNWTHYDLFGRLADD